MFAQNYEIGRRFDSVGKPLFVADGKVIGTVESIKDIIRMFEENAAIEHQGKTEGAVDFDAAVVAAVKRAQAARVL